MRPYNPAVARRLVELRELDADVVVVAEADAGSAILLKTSDEALLRSCCCAIRATSLRRKLMRDWTLGRDLYARERCATRLADPVGWADLAMNCDGIALRKPNAQ